ncbi:MAG: hypothetical protein QF619_00500 [Candidatus Binatia bacterium]|jgi:hypothetical protein|nr:hypothetical protein [Dehalococcoidia bacterium]MDP6558611.1 hypothetical protein [Candidatus Binatia bacterium]
MTETIEVIVALRFCALALQCSPLRLRYVVSFSEFTNNVDQVRVSLVPLHVGRAAELAPIALAVDAGIYGGQ